VVAYEDVLVMRIPEENFDEFIRNNSANAISIMRNLANTLLTFSCNVNMVLEELKEEKKIKAEAYQDITSKVRLYTALDSKNQSRFTTSV